MKTSKTSITLLLSAIVGTLTAWAINDYYANIGTFNQTSTWGALAVGDGNYHMAEGVTVGFNNLNYAPRSMTVGTGNTTWVNDATVVGRYATDFYSTSGALFVVGNGTSSSNRDHAFVVKDNGAVEVGKSFGGILSNFNP